MIDGVSALEDLQSFEAHEYQGVSKDNLLCFGVSLLAECSVPATFENITVALFKLFPDDFSLVGFPQYPDAARVNRTLLHCRPNYRNLVAGNAKSGYALTKKGHYLADQIGNQLGVTTEALPREDKPSATGKRTYMGGQIVGQIEGSRLYASWHDQMLDSVGEYEIWDFLEAVPYTAKGVLRDILKSYREAAQLAGREDLVEFLSWVSQRYGHVFHDEGGD